MRTRREAQQSNHTHKMLADITGCESRFSPDFSMYQFDCAHAQWLVLLLLCIFLRGGRRYAALSCQRRAVCLFHILPPRLHELQRKLNKFTILQHIPKIIMKLLECHLATWLAHCHSIVRYVFTFPPAIMPASRRKQRTILLAQCDHLAWPGCKVPIANRSCCTYKSVLFGIVLYVEVVRLSAEQNKLLMQTVAEQAARVALWAERYGCGWAGKT